MARPPRRPVRPSDRRIALVFVTTVLIAAIIAFAVALWPSDGDDEVAATPTPPAAVVATPTAPPPTTPTPELGALFTRPCPASCLIRLTDDEPAHAALAARGLRPTFIAAGQIWTGGSAADVEALRAAGVTVGVVADSADTLHLYAVRAKEGTAAKAIRAAGEIVDQVGEQYIVRVPKAPPSVGTLIAEGIWVEKFPPILPALPSAKRAGEKPPLTPDQLVDLVWSVDSERIYETIVNLQGMSSTDGTGIGTRHYTSTGNVMAAELIYASLAEAGARVWYEDFVTDDGLLALNVVGELPGRDTSQVYLVLAHYDSLNPADLSSSPGADDNATGVAAMLEIARLLGGYDLAYPVRFFATNVEEVGLQGVKAFAARAAAEGTPIVGAFNLDAVGSVAHGSQIVFNGDEASAWLEDLLIRVNDEYGLGQDIIAKINPVIVADDNFLRDYGFPTILIARELFGWSTLHHTADDTVETVDLYNVKMAAALVLGGLANLVVIS